MSRYRRFFDNEENTMEDLWTFTIENMVFVDNDEGIILDARVQDYLSGKQKDILIASPSSSSEQIKEHYLQLYDVLFPGTTFRFEKIENATPRKLLEVLTDVKDTDTPMEVYLKLRSYQVLHVFKRIHNPYAYLAPWNIIMIPKVLQPFLTYNEKYVEPKFMTSGQRFFYEKHQEELPEFEIRIKKFIYERYKEDIDNFNEEMLVLGEKVQPFFEEIREKYGEEIYFKVKLNFNRDFAPVNFSPQLATK